MGSSISENQPRDCKKVEEVLKTMDTCGVGEYFIIYIIQCFVRKMFQKYVAGLRPLESDNQTMYKRVTYLEYRVFLYFNAAYCLSDYVRCELFNSKC